MKLLVGIALSNVRHRLYMKGKEMGYPHTHAFSSTDNKLTVLKARR
jgi:hypothetical protein